MWNRMTASALVAALVLSIAGTAPVLEAGEKGYLGVLLTAASPTEEEAAALVEEVVSESPAEKAGVKTGDRIVSAAGKAINSPEDLKQIVQSRQADLSSVANDVYLEVTRGLLEPADAADELRDRYDDYLEITDG